MLIYTFVIKKTGDITYHQAIIVQISKNNENENNMRILRGTL